MRAVGALRALLKALMLAAQRVINNIALSPAGHVA